MNKVSYDSKQVRDLYDAGRIAMNHVSPEVLERIIAASDSGARPVWALSDFNPNVAPNPNDGVTICYSCGWMYWVTPTLDAFPSPKGDQCLGCMIDSEMGE